MKPDSMDFHHQMENIFPLTAWKVKLQLKIHSFNHMGMIFGHFNAKI